MMATAEATFSATTRASVRNRRAPRGTRFLVRLPVALVLAAVAVVPFFTEKLTRLAEVTLASHVFNWLSPNKAFVATDHADPIVWYFSPNGWVGLQVSPECSIAFYVSGILVFGALLSLLPRLALHRVLIATVVAIGMMITLNQVRFGGLGFIAGNYDRQTFDWAHTFGGSTLMIVGLCLSLLLFFLITGGRKKLKPATS